jgi:hypothetical protein
MVLFTDMFKFKATVGHDFIRGDIRNIKIKKDQFYLFDEHYSYIFCFKQNPYRHLEFPVYASIYLLIVLLGFTFRKTH